MKVGGGVSTAEFSAWRLNCYLFSGTVSEDWGNGGSERVQNKQLLREYGVTQKKTKNNNDL